jgi:hypothetical protein
MEGDEAMGQEFILRSKSHDCNDNDIEICITLDRAIVLRMADKAAKSASGQATDGALTATVSPPYRKQAKESYRRWRTLAARREDTIFRLLRNVCNEHEPDE